MESSIFIKTLEYGENVGLKGTTWPLFEKWAEENCLKGSGDKTGALKRIFTECFAEINESEQVQSRYILKIEYTLRLSEHRKLDDAKMCAHNARRSARTALIFAALAICVSVVIGGTFAFKSASRASDVVNALNQSNKRSGVQEVEINKLQMAQLLSAIERSQSKIARKPAVQRHSNEGSMLDAINRYYEQ